MRSRLRMLWVASVASLVVTAGLVQGPAAQAAIDTKPARTWGVGPASATSASSGNPRVLAILPLGDRIFVGGTFDSVIDPAGVSYPVKNVAVFSARTGAADLTFRGSANATVTSLTTDGSRVYLGGTFTSVNGVSRRGLAALDATTGALAAWEPSALAGQVDALAYSGGWVYAGGNFDAITGSNGLSSQRFAAKVSAASGAVDSGWAVAPDDRVRALNVAANGSGRLYLGGDFTTVSGRTGTNRLASVLLASPGSVDTTFRAGPTNGTGYAPIFDLTSDANRVYAASAGIGGACAALSATTGAALWSAHSNGNMQSVRLLGSLLYCGGHFGGTGSFMGQTRNKLAAVDAVTGALSSFAPNINSSQGPWALAVDAGHLYIGGDFSKISGVPQPHFAMFIDTSIRSAPQPPEALRAQAVSGAVNLSWKPPSSDGGWPLQKYKVYRSTASGGQDLTRAALVTLSKDAQTYSDVAVVNGTTYYYVLVATNVAGASAPSPEVSARPSSTGTVVAPSAPTAVTIDSQPGSLHIAWNPPASTGGAPVTSYRVYRGGAPGAEDRSAPLATTSDLSFDDVYGLTAGSTYYYVVTAVNQAGESVASAEVSATATQGVPGAPTLTLSLASGPSVQLRWTIPPDGGSPITKYVILRDGVRLVTLLADASGGPTSYLDTTVMPGTTYTYQVRAANIAGNGQLSRKETITIP